MNHPLTVLACALFVLTGLNAQVTAPSVIASDGGTGEGAGIRIDYTLGELAVDGLTGQPASMTEGFQQPYLRIEYVPDRIPPAGETEPAASRPIITLSPNPVTASLTVKPGRELPGPMTLTVHDAHGIRVDQHRLDPGRGDSHIDMSGLIPGTYYFHFRSADPEMNATYKIIKIQ